MMTRWADQDEAMALWPKPQPHMTVIIKRVASRVSSCHHAHMTQPTNLNGRTKVTVTLLRETHLLIKVLSALSEKTIQDLLHEATIDLHAKYGSPEIRGTPKPAEKRKRA